MDRSTDILIKKLSTRVEDLQIDKRTRSQLKHASLYTVAEILLAGKPKLRSVRNIGPISAGRIWEAIAGHLGLPEDRLAAIAPSQEEDYLEVWDAPITALQLPQPTLAALRSMGLSRVQELIKARSMASSKFLGMLVKEIDEIKRVLSLYMVQAAQARFLDLAEKTAVHVTQSLEQETIPVPDLEMPLPKLSAREWSLLEFRAMQLATMEQTGAKFGLSIGKVRRSIEQAHDQLRRKLIFLSLFLDHFEKKAETLRKDLGNGSLDLKTLTQHLLAEPALPDLPVDEEKVERLIVLIRSMVLQPCSCFKVQMEPRWPSFILLSCLVEPSVARHEQVRWILHNRKQERKSKPYRELANQVLAQAGKPMHFSAIAEEARRLGGRDSLERKTLYCMLSTHKDLFLRVGPGTYALAEWGGQTPEFYPTIIASVLREANRPMPAVWICDRVSAIRPIMPSSLKMILNLHFRFYKSIQNTYGLRAWLPEGDAQKLLLPDWLVETPASLKRVERARAKGKDVEKILAKDRAQQDPGEAVV